MALRQPKILVLLAMVAAVTFADDPVQVLGPSLARQVLGVSSLWPAYFLSALGLGTVLGSLLPVRPTNSRQVALSLGALAMFMMVFATGLNPWLSLAAAVMAGMAALLTGASAQAMLLSEAGRGRATQVMALWAVAWAGTKPIASLADGWLASTFNVRTAVVILAAPAIVVALLELAMRGKPRARIQELMRKHDEAQASS
jgi:MFS family permease